MTKKQNSFLFLSFLLIHANCLTKWSPFTTQKDPSTGKTESTNRTIKNMDYHELLERKNKHAIAGNHDVVIRYLENMENKCPDAKSAAKTKLELANAYLEDGQFAKGEKKFEEYTTLYQEDEKMDYAAHKRILCSHHQELDHDRDQSKTQETIKLIDIFVKQYDTSPYIAQMKEIRIVCREKLAQSEMSIVKDLINRKRYNDAQNRITYIKTHFISEFSNLQDQLAQLETKLPQEKQAVLVAKSEDNKAQEQATT